MRFKYCGKNNEKSDIPFGRKETTAYLGQKEINLLKLLI